MKYSKEMLPVEVGADDFNDSARMAGLMTATGYTDNQNWNKKLLVKYVQSDDKGSFYVRHPGITSPDMSRDQAMCLIVGLYLAGFSRLISLDMVRGKDWFSPSQKGIFRICQGGTLSWFASIWFWCDVVYSCVHPSDDLEDLQLICMMLVAPPKYLKYWVYYNTKWKTRIVNYFCGWRNEPELAQYLIDYISGVALFRK